MWLSKWKADSCLIEKHAQALSATIQLETTQSELISSSKGALLEQELVFQPGPVISGNMLKTIHRVLRKKKHTDLNPRPWPMLSEYNPSERKMDPYCAAATKTSQQSEVWKRLSTMQHEKMFLIWICNVVSLFQLVFKKLILTKPISQWGTKCILGFHKGSLADFKSHS